MAGLAVALRFVPYSDDAGHLNVGWTVLMAVLFLLVARARASTSSTCSRSSSSAASTRSGCAACAPTRPTPRSTPTSRSTCETGEFESVRRETEDFPAV